MRPEIYRRVIAAALMILSIIASVCHAESTRTIIIFPQVKAPTQRIFDAIIEGIEQTLPDSTPLTVDQRMQPEQLDSVLNSFNPERIIVLGRATADRIASSPHRDKMIVAGALFEPDEFAGVTLAIDSRRLLQEIKTILPSLRRVFVVGSPRQLHIRIYPASLRGQPAIVPELHEDPLINSRQLWQLLEQADPKTDAIILPSQLDRDILYELAQLAWQKKIILLSTNLAHLNQGVLMVFYPDNIGMGRQIGDFTIQHPGPGFESLTHIHIALNPTVAKHLGLSFAPQVLSRTPLQVK
ncbi:hypothetical protein [Methylotuvimicrobium sp. KM1]|uniref:hypothetical protein n=1 Tax=Methylotuvimicrobium sp. KM1 TaxID=3377707 RepID=UPI00384D52C2